MLNSRVFNNFGFIFILKFNLKLQNIKFIKIIVLSKNY